MNDFEKSLLKLNEEADGIKQREAILRRDQELFGQKLAGFLKENGLPADFTMTEWAALAIRKSRDLIKLS